MLDYLIDKDKAIFLYLNGLGTEPWDGFWLFVSHKFSALPLYVLLLVLCFLRFRWKSVVLLLVAVALMITLTDQLANVFKYGFERLRPCHDESLLPHMRRVICGGSFGYFSAHAASSMAVAVFFSKLLHHYKWLPLVLFPWAIAVGYSRIYLGVHYPGDVLTGMIFGTVIALGFAWLWKKAALRINPSNQNS